MISDKPKPNSCMFKAEVVNIIPLYIKAYSGYWGLVNNPTTASFRFNAAFSWTKQLSVVTI
jgi:hypothetical protein